MAPTGTSPRRIGVMFDRARPPEELVEFARGLEDAGVDELWVVEDLGWGGAIASAAAALAGTERMVVGIGIVPAPFRNPALLAMELATLERLHPTRLLAGIGHGVGSWMAQVGAAVASPLTLLEETIVGVRALLGGEKVEVAGRYVKLDGIQLVHPPEAVPPLLAGVTKPRSLRLSGRVADGTILAEGSSPTTVRAALETIGATSAHQLVVLTHHCVSDDQEMVRTTVDRVRLEFFGRESEGGDDDRSDDDDTYMAAGTADRAASKISALWAAGTDCVVLRPVGGNPLMMVRETLAALNR